MQRWSLKILNSPNKPSQPFLGTNLEVHTVESRVWFCASKGSTRATFLLQAAKPFCGCDSLCIVSAYYLLWPSRPTRPTHTNTKQTSNFRHKSVEIPAAGHVWSKLDWSVQAPAERRLRNMWAASVQCPIEIYGNEDILPLTLAVLITEIPSPRSQICAIWIAAQ